ncbi:WD40-repeat-containing domain protein [Gongronella butleri]|nr:WD40-repeat-containing domain protein [Gongronella butleri]
MARQFSIGEQESPQQRLPAYPLSSDHSSTSFVSPEGVYELSHKIFFRSLAPYYRVGSKASLVSIKYKESTVDKSRYEAQPGARSFRGLMFGESSNHHHSQHPDRRASLTPLHKSVTLPTAYASAPTSPQSPTAAPSNVPFSLPSSTNAMIPSALTRTQSSSIDQRRASAQWSPSSSRKPKTSLTKTNSSFVQRIITNEQLASILVARTSEDTNLFYNCGPSFVWMDATCRPAEPLSRIIFNRAYPTCHDVNLLTRGAAHLDIIIGFTSGDIIWFDPLCNKYGRLNKGGVMNASEITMIRWIQGSENLVMAAFQDGSVMVFDKDKEDGAALAVSDDTAGASSSASSSSSASIASHPPSTHQKHISIVEPMTSSSSHAARTSKQMFRVSRPSSKQAKHNPVSHWKLSGQSITAFAFSPDCQHVAVVGLDGYLRVINYLQEKLQDVYEAYYGGLLCVAWSPDGRYILTGGQDDLVTIWAFREQRIVARCQGHSSWVTSVAFDPWRCDERVYRFASVGEDAKLVLWDFSVSAIHRPKSRVNARHRGASVSSTTHPTVNLKQETAIHPVISKADVAILQPTVVNTVHADPCVGVYYREDVIVTTDKRGRVCTWKRPQ